MKTRLLVSLMVIAMAAAMIGGATMAWFTDSAKSPEVSFSAGTLLIDIDNAAFSNIELDKLNTLNPGDEFEYSFDVKNIGTKNFIFMGLMCYEDTIGQENPNLSADMRQVLAEKNYGTNPLSEALDIEISVGGGTPFYTGKLSAYDNAVHPVDPPTKLPDGVTLEANSHPLVFGEAGPMAPTDSYTYTVKISLDKENVDNKYQGSSIRAAFVVMAKQAFKDDAEYGAFECPLSTIVTNNTELATALGTNISNIQLKGNDFTGFTVNRPVTLIGGEVVGGITIGSGVNNNGNVTFKGLTIIGPANGSGTGIAINNSASVNLVVDGVTVKGFKTGLSAEEYKVIVKNSTFEDNWAGIGSVKVAASIFTNNEFKVNGAGWLSGAEGIGVNPAAAPYPQAWLNGNNFSGYVAGNKVKQY